MPRGKKQKAVVLYSTETGAIIGHAYHYNPRNNDKAKVFSKRYDPKLRKRVEVKVKEEKHSSGA